MKVVNNPKLKEIADNFVEVCRKQESIDSYFKGFVSLETPSFEDKNIRIFLSQIDKYKKQLNKLVDKDLSIKEKILKNELIRSCNQREFLYLKNNPYNKNFNAYIRLISSGFIPLIDIKNEKLLIDRLNFSVVLLKQAKNKLIKGEIIITTAEKATLIELKKAIKLLVQKYLLTKIITNTFTLFEKIIEELTLLKYMELKTPKTSFNKEVMTSFLTDVVGTNNTISDLDQMLEDRILGELERFNHFNQLSLSLEEMVDTYNFSFSFEKTISSKNYPTWDFIFSAYEHLKGNDYILNRIKGSANIKEANDLENLLIPEGLFLPGNQYNKKSQLIISSSLINSQERISLRLKLYLIMLITHEVAPGHNEHSLKAGSFNVYMDVIQNNTGLEGWAVYCERTLLNFGPEASLLYHYQIIRRVLPVAVRFKEILHGKDAANEFLQHLLKVCPYLKIHFKKFGIGAIGATNLSYALGLLETEQAIEKIKTDLKITEKSAAKLYINEGPITPRNVVSLVTNSEIKQSYV